MNGPCGGVRDGGKCEVIADFDCVWVAIYDKLEKEGQLDKMLVIQEARNTNYYADLVDIKTQE